MKKSTTSKFTFFCLLSVIFVFAFAVNINAQINTAYAFTQTSEPYAPITGGTVLGTATASGTGNATLDDVVFPAVLSSAWPFSFQFNFLTVTQIFVSSNDLNDSGVLFRLR